MGTVYIIHITPPFKHARHYVGYTDIGKRRFKAHEAGRGARLLSVAVAAGHEIAVVHEYFGKNRKFERWLKNKGGASRYCPACKAERKAAREAKKIKCEVVKCQFRQTELSSSPVSSLV